MKDLKQSLSKLDSIPPDEICNITNQVNETIMTDVELDEYFALMQDVSSNIYK